MALICDTGPIYALYDADDAHHEAVKAAVEAERGTLFLPLLLSAEIDYLLHVRLGVDAALDFLQSVSQGTFSLIVPTIEDLNRCRELVRQYRDLSLGLADASVIATAERLRIQRVLTIDHRHFRAIQPLHFTHFILIPADES